MWSAMREMIKGYMYMASQCEGFRRGITKVADGDEIHLEAKLGEEFSYEVKKANATGFRVNDRCDLPEGFTFNNGVLSGTFNHVGLYRVDVIADGSTKAGIKLIIEVSPDEAEYDETIMTRWVKPKEKKKGCGGEIATASLIALISLAGLGLALVAVDRKRRRA